MIAFQKMRFGDLYLIPSRNGVYKSGEFHGSGYPIVNMGELFKFNFIGNQRMNLINLNENEIKINSLQDGDLLFGRRSLIESGAGKCSLVINHDKQTTFESSIIRVRVNKNNTNPRFLYYYFLSPIGSGKIRAIVSGTNVKGIRGSDLERIYITIPELSAQNYIANMVKAYDDLIENNENRIKILEEIAKRVYIEWFAKFKFPGFEKIRMVDSPLGKIPEGWEIKKFNSLANIVSGYPFKSLSYQKNGKYKIVTIKNVHDGLFIRKFDSSINILPINLPEACTLNSGDILLSLTGNVGRACVVYGNNHLLNQRVAKLIPSKLIFREYIFSMLNQNSFQRKLEAIANGAAQQNLSPIQLSDLKIILPKQEILTKFNNFISNNFDLVLNLREQNYVLAQNRDLIIPQILTGKRELRIYDQKNKQN